MSSEHLFPDGIEIVEVSLDGTPEETADALIADSLPSIYLSDVDLSTPEGLLVLIKALMFRRYRAAVEYDELVTFVERNRASLTDGALLNDVQQAAESAQNDELTGWVLHLVQQIRYVLDGRPELVVLGSDRLLWLCVALYHHLDSNRLDFAAARHLLAEPQHRARMRPSAVEHLFADYWHNMDELDSPRVYYVMVITECAILADLINVQVMAAVLLSSLPPPGDPAAWLAQRQRLRNMLGREGHWSNEMEQSLARAVARFDEHVADDDF